MRGLALIAPIAIVGCVIAPTPASEVGDRAAVLGFADRWRAAYEARNLEALMAMYEPDAWLMTRNRPVKKGRDAIAAYFRAVLAAPASLEPGPRITFTPEDVTIDADYAFLVAQWRLEGASGREAGRSLVILKQGRDGVWRLWRDIDNTAPDVLFEDALP